MGQSSAGQVPEDARKRRRTVEDGRIVTNIADCFGKYIAEQAEDLGISPSTVARMLLVEAIKARGFTKAILEERYKTPAPTVTGAQPLAAAV